MDPTPRPRALPDRQRHARSPSRHAPGPRDHREPRVLASPCTERWSSEGRAALVKLMADPESATLVVNGCLFLNVLSFRYLDFEQLAEERWRFMLLGDGSTLRAGVAA